MHRLISLSFLPALLFSTSALAQATAEPPPPPPPLSSAPPPPPWIAPQNIIDLNPIALLNGELSLEYERALGSHISLLLGPDVVVFRGLGSVFPKDALVRGGALKIGFHFFPWGNALSGFWFGPEIIGTVAGVRPRT